MSQINASVTMIHSLWIAIIFNISVTALHLIVWASVPFDSQHSVIAAWQIFLVFQAVFLIAIFVFHCFCFERFTPSFAITILMKINLKWPLVLSIVGLVLHIFAKYPILQGLDLDCMTQVRHAWMSYNKNDDPTWRRIFSMMAYILSHFAMPVIFISAFRLAKEIRNNKHWIYFITSLIAIIIFAMIIVSRMTLLTALVIANSGCILALIYAGKEIRKTLFRSLIVFSMLFILIFGLSYFVAKTRIKCSGNNIQTYMSSNLEDAKAKWKEPPTVLGRKCESCLSIGHYMTHGVWNLSQLTGTSERGSIELFAFVNHYMSRIGIKTNLESKKRVFGPGGIGLAGAAYHDYGWTGVTLSAIASALLWVLSINFLNRKLTFYFGFVLFPCLVFTLAIQFLFVGPATISFPFTATSFLLISFFQKN